MRNFYVFLIAVLVSGLGFGQTTVTIDFETVDDGYTTSTTIGSGWEDVFNRSNYNMTVVNNEDGFYWAVEDIDGTPSMDLTQIDVTGATEFTFSIDWIAHHFDDWDGNTEFNITYSLDSGVYQNLIWVRNICNCTNAPAAVDLGFDGMGDCGTTTTLPSRSTGSADGCTVAAIRNQFETYVTSAIALSGNSSLDIRLDFANFTQSDQGIYFDNIVIEHDGGAPSCTAPTTQASAYNTTALGADSATLNWTSGNGEEVLVVMREAAAVNADPTNGTSYTGNTIFTSGTEIGTGNYAVYAGTTASTVSVTGLNPSTTYHVAVYEYNTLDTCYELTQLTGSFTTAAVTTVQFSTTSVSVAEDIGTYDLVIQIANEDVAATTFDVVLTSGTAADIDSYTTQSESFPGSSTTDVTVTITVTDDATVEGDEVFTFEIQTVAGGNSAVVGTNNSFDLTILANDTPPITLPYTEDFSNCGTAEWTPFDEAGDDSWSCTSGEYVMNGFGGTDDIDWLVSNFSIDFDVTGNENIEVTTSERYGNAINEAGEFELRYSTDYSGSGDPTLATWTALTFDPNNTSSGGTPSPDSTTIVDASVITGVAYLAFVYDMTGVGAEEWSITDITIEEVVLTTLVELTSTSATVAENAGTYDLEFSITNEDAADTTFDVVLTSGTAIDINNYTTQQVTFAGGTSTNQTVTVTITNDVIEEIDETFTFEIQNVAGGNSAAVGTNNSFDLTILANDVVAGWQISAEDTAFVIDFDNTVADVNLDAYLGTGFTASPASGQLDSDAWEVTGLSQGALTYGGTRTSGDYTGTADGSTTGGGLYAFDTGGSNSTLGVQPTGSDFTPGTITLRAQNQTGSTVTAADLAYLVYVYNDGGRSNSFNFSYSTDNSTYTNVAALDLTSTATADGSPAWESNLKLTSVTGLSIGVGEYLYLRWSSDYFVPGSGSVDQFALDDIRVTFNPGPPETYTYSGSWAPSDPNGVAAFGDAIVIASGDATIGTSTTCNSVTVNAGAGLTVNTGIALTVSNGLTLESTSSSYSSLILDGSITGTVNYERHVNGNSGLGDTNANGNNDLISPPLSGQTFGAFASANSNLRANPGDANEKAFAPFDKSTGTYANYFITTNAATTLDPGVGYRVATNNTATLTFTGTVNTGTVTNNIVNSGPAFADWNVVGNPYPSYLKVQDFLNYEVATGVTNLDLFQPSTAAIYGYDGDATGANGSGYTIYNLATTDVNTVIAPGQGFIVSADAAKVAAHDLTFTPTMRAPGTSDDFIAGRSSTLLTFLKLNASTANADYTTQFYFNDNASQGLDPGYDAAVFGTVPAFSLYSLLVQDNTGLPIALQTLNPSDLTNVTIPLGVNANQGEQLTFTISDTTLPSTVDVYLDDTVAGSSTLLNTGDYVLTPISNLNGTSRVFLRFADNALSTVDNTFDTLSIYTNDTDKTIVIAGQLLEATTAHVYDIQGRLVLSKALHINAVSNTIASETLQTGVYMIQLANGNQTRTEKVIIN
jgi:hypothetical protein